MIYSLSNINQPIATKRSVKVLLCAAIVFAFLSVFFSSGATGSAANGADFKAGRIIDDVVFTNNQSMSVSQIQAFLDAKVPVCDRWRPSSNPNYQPPWTCLKEYQENPTTGDNNISHTGRGPNGEPRQVPGGISAAQIIWNAAQAHNISPQVILVTLQKEQSLVTDDWPWAIQYFRAMGANCPDGPGGAQCNPAYAGFLKQVDGGTWQFRHDFNGIGTPGFWAPYARGWNNILYQDPNTTGGCGTKQVLIENQATAVLYKYTPYTPNQAALNNLYGTGDACSAYGNRNFWRLFTDWFGSTYAPTFQATFLAHSTYPTIVKGSSSEALIRYRNTGNLPWYDDVSAPLYNTYPVRLAKTNPINSSSPFSASWPSSGRATGAFAKVYEPDGLSLSSNQHIALPGQIVDFGFNFNIPVNTTPGFYPQYFQPVLEGSNWWNMGGVAWIGVTVQDPTFQATFVAHTTYPTILNGGSSDALIRYRNTGNLPWYDDVSAPLYNTYPVRLATTNPINSSSPFSSLWSSNSRATGPFGRVYEPDGLSLSPNQHVALPGQIVDFNFTFSIPTGTTPGFYPQYFQPVLEGSNWWNMGGVAWIGVTVQ